MHEIFDSPPNVLALKVSNTITGEDLDAIMDKTDEILAREDKIHVFVETEAVNGLQLSAVPRHLSRSLPMFGRLHRFGRVAVVADQAWMRLATQFESAVLPSVSYRVFGPEKRDEAKAWVFGSETAVAA